MIKLHGRIQQRWDQEPFVVKVTHNADLPVPLRANRALLISSPLPASPMGFRAYLCADQVSNDWPRSSDDTPLILLPESLRYLGDGDIVRVIPLSGEIVVMYRRNSPSNSILVTERCNSKCLMCSQPPKEHDDSYLVEEYLKAIPLMDPLTEELGITGGEPTLLGDRFLQLIQTCKNYLPETALHILSNGRLFSYLTLAESVGRIKHPNLMIGIPVYSDIAHVHDFVVQAQGAFDQTIRGIMNLRRCGVRIEIRVVIHKQTYGRLPQLARFITRNLPYVDHVALMGLEMMGYVKMNMDALWIDPIDYQCELQEAVCQLEQHGMHVSIYNHQLCVLPKNVWSVARKSISDWKNEYFDQCESCDVRDECGGFFWSSKIRHSAHIKPIKEDVLAVA